ncbi:glycosyltransferase family 4 protein [Brevibacillus porteri]|uniref:glycosyltransferase family 4 protein n=1 Tax=Brevibacillus porteri TaxID=2126350 RepID=UPI00037104BF|nr:glycosyltransferase WbuB [Brevibacillus brevis X23]
MKSIWIVNQYSVTPEYPASTRHYELAKYLGKQYKVTLWGSNFIHHNKQFRFSRWTLAKKQFMEGFCFLWLGSIAYKDNGPFRMINMLLYACWFWVVGLFQRDKPDVIIGSSPPLFTAFSAMLVAKIRKAVFILEIRDLWPDSLVDITGKDDTFVIKILRWMERVLYQKADKIVVLTEGISSRIQQKGIRADKIFFLPNGIDLENVSMPEDCSVQRNTIREQMGIGQHDFVFMYAGAHGPANDLMQIIEAAKLLRKESNIKIVLMGEGVEKGKLQQKVMEYGLDNNVLFLPAVSKVYVQKYLSCADAFIICLKDVPLFEGALPNKLFDYLMHDKPIITTVRGEIEAFLKRNHLGIYGNMKEDGSDFLPTVIYNLAQGNMYPLVCLGKEIVEQYFSREMQAKELVAIIER